MSDPTDAKRELRSTMRAARRDVADPEAESSAIVDRLVELAPFRGVHTVMLFDAVPGEPDLERFARWCGEHGIRVVEPTPDPTATDPVAPGDVDVVVVPGLAFTPDGRRLGQGGGWYDRFLARCRPGCAVVGVCFDGQIVDDVPTEAHDRRVDWIVTPTAARSVGLHEDL